MTAWAAFQAQLGLHGLGWGELLQLWLHFCLLSMIAVGGAITTAPDMHRWLVQQQHWIGDEQFAASIALAQAAPGPNILFVALLGWNVAGLAGLVAAMAGIMGPSSALAFAVGRWGRRNAQARPLRAFTTGMVPVTIGLLLSTAWVLAAPLATGPVQGLGVAALVGLTLYLSVRTKVTPLLPIAIGAVAGALGLA
jgi:chromate transporter